MAKKPKLTPWFPGEVMPARDGVYEFRNTGHGKSYGRFSRGTWFATTGTVKDAANTPRASIWPLPAEREGDNCWAWRGLAEEPKQ